MKCKERYFDGKNQEVKIKFPGAMVRQLERLRIEDERHSVQNEAVYLLGCKLEALENVRKQREDRKNRLSRLSELKNQLPALWKAITMAQRPKELDTLIPELRSLLEDIQTAQMEVDDIVIQPEAGVPCRWDMN